MTEEAHPQDMPTIRIIETIPLSAKKVRSEASHSDDGEHTDVLYCAVCVSSVLIDEIKRIIRTSEIMKYVEDY